MTTVYEFGEFTLDVDERTVMRGIHRVHLAPKTFDVLVALVARASRLVSKGELLDRVWPDVFVEEGILTVHVAQLRKALGDVRRAPRYIETVSRSGYRFIATVRRLRNIDDTGGLTPPQSVRDRSEARI